MIEGLGDWSTTLRVAALFSGFVVLFCFVLAYACNFFQMPDRKAKRQATIICLVRFLPFLLVAAMGWMSGWMPAQLKRLGLDDSTAAFASMLMVFVVSLPITMALELIPPIKEAKSRTDHLFELNAKKRS